MTGALLGATGLLLTGLLHASEVKWADPLPNTPAIKAADAVPATADTPAIPAVTAVAASGGIGYEWTVTMGDDDYAELVGSVGAKSAYEPTFQAPEFAWQHTSNYIALDLTADATVTIMVNRQQGVQTASLDKTTKALVIKEAGNRLNPVVVVWKNWEESGVETGSFNPLGKTSWMNELVYIGIAYADKGQSTVMYSGQLAKGKYTLNIAGANAYEPNGCPASDTECYTGNHGYRVEISTGSGAVDHSSHIQ